MVVVDDAFVIIIQIVRRGWWDDLWRFCSLLSFLPSMMMNLVNIEYGCCIIIIIIWWIVHNDLITQNTDRPDYLLLLLLRIIVLFFFLYLVLIFVVAPAHTFALPRT
jgi:hypothetical protein